MDVGDYNCRSQKVDDDLTLYNFGLGLISVFINKSFFFPR